MMSWYPTQKHFVMAGMLVLCRLTTFRLLPPQLLLHTAVKDSQGQPYTEFVTVTLILRGEASAVEPRLCSTTSH